MEDEVSFSLVGIIVICCTAFLAGISRTAMPGLGILLASLVAQVMPARASTGFLLPILVMADMVAVIYWRRIKVWPQLLRILPWTVVGVVCGWLLMGRMSESLFKPVMGGMILLFVALDFVRRRLGIELKTENKLFVALMGVLAGTFTMMANAAGPIMTIYLMTMDLPKDDFVGINAWFFFIVNLVKVPFSVALGLITWDYLKIDLALAPLILAGAVVGAYVVKRLPRKLFDFLVKALAAVAGLKLLF
jgi:uncharacterized protein